MEKNISKSKTEMNGVFQHPKNYQKELVFSISLIYKVKLMSNKDIKNIPVISHCTV